MDCSKTPLRVIRNTLINFFPMVVILWKTKYKYPYVKVLPATLAVHRQKNGGGGFYWRGASIRENTVGVSNAIIDYHANN